MAVNIPNVIVNSSWTFLTILFLSFGMFRLSVGEVTPAQCSLATIYGLKTADCTNLNLDSLPRYLDGDLKTLTFHGNRLTFLGMDSFQAYPSLQNLLLVRNRLEEIAPDAFRGLRNLQRLDLEGNKLKAIPVQALRHLSSLRFLSLKSNPIAYVTNGDLRHLRNLEELNFENCWLTRIEPRAFAELSNLNELNLVNNELRGLDADMEDALSKTLTIIRLHSNPWQCDCRLRWLRKLLLLFPNWEFGPNTPSCAGPDLIRGVSWKHLSPDQFACPSTIVGNSTTSIELRAGSNVSIECIVFGDPEPVISWLKGAKPIGRESISDGTFLSGANMKEKHIRSVVVLKDITPDDASDYKCIAVNPAGRSEVTYKVWIVGAETPLSPEKSAVFSLGLEVILGVVIAGVGLVVVFLACVCCVVARQRNRRRETHKMQDKEAKKENAFSTGAIGVADGAAEKSVEALEDVQAQDRHNRETLMVLTSVESQTPSGKGSPIIRQTPLPVESRNDNSWAEDKELCASDEDTLTSEENAVQAQNGAKGEESDEFKMKIFPVQSTGGELCDDHSSNASNRSREFITEAVGDRDKSQVSLDRINQSPRIRFKESPPDLLCDRHVMINSIRDKKPDRRRPEAVGGRDIQEQRDTSQIASTLDESGRDTRPSNIEAFPIDRKPLPTPREESVKSPVKVGTVSHCDNPVCLKDRLCNLERVTTGSPPVAPDCSRKSTHGKVHHHNSTVESPAPDLRDRRSAADLDSKTGVDGSDISIRGSLRNFQRADAYATLPVKASHRRRVEFTNLCSTISKHQPSTSQMRSRHISPRAAMTRSLASDYASSPSCKMSSAIVNRSTEQPRSYVTDYATNQARTLLTSSDWLEVNHARSGDYALSNHSSASKLSGSSSTLDIREVRDYQTPLLSRRTQGCSATSLLDILSPPFGHQTLKQKTSNQQQFKKPKPGEQDEFGTAV